MTAMTSRELGITSPAERAAAAQRRDASKRVRFVRDKLTSTSASSSAPRPNSGGCGRNPSM